MPPELSVLLIIFAGFGGFALGRLSKKKESRSVSLDSYNCTTKEAVLTIMNGPQTVAAYAWDNSAGAAVAQTLPPQNAATVAGSSGSVTITNVPHQNGAQKILLQIWGIDSLVEHSKDCDASSSPTAENERQFRKTVLP